MSWAFTSAGTSNYTVTAAPITAHPLTIACWFNPDNSTAGMELVSVHTAGTVNHRWMLTYRGDLGGDVCAATSVQGGAVNASGLSSTGSTAGAWSHGGAVFASATSRTAYRGGIAGTTQTTSITPSGVDTVTIGRPDVVSLGGSTDAKIAEVGIWAAALSTADMLMLARGVCPLLVRPGDLVFYAPLVGPATSQPDRVGGATLSQTNTPTVYDHPAIFYPPDFQLQGKRRTTKRYPILTPSLVRGSIL